LDVGECQQDDIKFGVVDILDCRKSFAYFHVEIVALAF
jgi:hypothetical protein